eukprot:780156-Pelagomonas_calceolata.AAC.1
MQAIIVYSQGTSLLSLSFQLHSAGAEFAWLLEASTVTNALAIDYSHLFCFSYAALIRRNSYATLSFHFVSLDNIKWSGAALSFCAYSFRFLLLSTAKQLPVSKLGVTATAASA